MAGMPDTEFFDYLKECGYVMAVPTGDGRWVGIMRLMYHYTMHEGKIGDMVGHDRRWCYADFDLAVGALNEWMLRGFEGKPERWHREPYTGMRRPDGDASKEYYAP